MKTIIGYTDSINECDCCGKTELKGTYCIDLDGVELYYGSVCAFKNHGLTTDEQKELKATFTKEQKNKKLIDLHIAPLRTAMNERLSQLGNSEFEMKYAMNNVVAEFSRVIKLRMKKYKIAL